MSSRIKPAHTHSQERIDAALEGKRFYMGPLCDHAHDDDGQGHSERDVAINKCVKCEKAYQRKADKKWRAAKRAEAAEAPEVHD